MPIAKKKSAKKKTYKNAAKKNAAHKNKGIKKTAKKKVTTGSGPQKMKAYASFVDWKRDQSAKHQKLITSLTRLIKLSAPAFSTQVKWGQGCWALEGVPKVFIHAEPDHLQFGFYAGSKLKDPSKLLVGNGKYVRHIKIFTANDIHPKELSAFLEQLK